METLKDFFIDNRNTSGMKKKKITVEHYLVENQLRSGDNLTYSSIYVSIRVNRKNTRFKSRFRNPVITDTIDFVEKKVILDEYSTFDKVKSFYNEYNWDNFKKIYRPYFDYEENCIRDSIEKDLYNLGEDKFSVSAWYQSYKANTTDSNATLNHLFSEKLISKLFEKEINTIRGKLNLSDVEIKAIIPKDPISINMFFDFLEKVGISEAGRLFKEYEDCMNILWRMGNYSILFDFFRYDFECNNAIDFFIDNIELLFYKNDATFDLPAPKVLKTLLKIKQLIKN